MYQLKIKEIHKILIEEKIFKEIIIFNSRNFLLPCKLENMVITDLSYDSRKISYNTLFFCKGHKFKKQFLCSAIHGGVKYYISEIPYEIDAIGFIVTNIHKAMAKISQKFYKNPEKKLKKIGITGTKGKTTTAYITKNIIENSTHQKVALFSSEETTTDGVKYTRSKLTTPESIDLYRQMAIAVENQIKYLIIEVSSQAYKMKRVYGIIFEIGIFLNISLDHISTLEHPNFDDYLSCKKEIIFNSQLMILNNDMRYSKLLKQTCKSVNIPYVTFSRKNGQYVLITLKNFKNFQILNKKNILDLQEKYYLPLIGRFNHENAIAAMIAAINLGISKEKIKKYLPLSTVPGRVQLLSSEKSPLVCIDYAHNYASIKAIGELGKELKPEGKNIFVTGSVGGKAFSRRPDIGKALSELANVVFLTSDDPDFDDPIKIAREIKASITNSKVKVFIEIDRRKAINKAITFASKKDIVLLCGKGTEKKIKIDGREEDYAGDLEIARKLIF